MTKMRHEARRIALQALYEIDCTGHKVADVMTQRLQQEKLSDEMRPFTFQLVNGVLEKQVTLDTLIQQHAPEWPVDQMALVDRNILRLAIYEIAVYGDTPLRVVINEAVELAKDFGADTAPRFVNGVLGSVVADVAALKAAFTGHEDVVAD